MGSIEQMTTIESGRTWHTSNSMQMTAALITLLAVVLASTTGCAPTVSRGGAGTNNPGLNDAALSTGLDKAPSETTRPNISTTSSPRCWGRSKPFS